MPARRKPETIRQLHGSRPRPPSPETADLSGSPRPPKWLPKGAKTEWKRVVEVCSRYDGWLQQVDRAALAAYCSAWAMLEEAGRDITERGQLVPGRSSADHRALVKNPSVQIQRDASASMLKWAKELGFTPDARGKINLHRLEALNPDTEELFSGAERFFSRST